MDPFVGEIRLFPWSWAPQGWALCNGAVLPLQQNVALYALIGTYYSQGVPNAGKTVFALPNLCGRVPVCYPTLGTQGGVESVVLTMNNLPPHTHSFNVVAATANKNPPAGNYLGQSTQGALIYVNQSPSPSPTVPLAPATITSTGGSAGHNNMQPSTVLNFCIAIQGIFPPRQ